jgi:hypothetical protein
VDANHDGQITSAEFKGTVPQFVRLDRDHDGTISRADLAKVLREPSAPQAAQATKAVAPVTKPVAAVTQTKVVRPVPVKPASQTPTPVARTPWTGRILAMDTNHDGKVCKAEYIKGIEVQFAHLDQDKDGVITAADITKILQARRTHHDPATQPAATGTPAKPVTGKPAAGVKTARIVPKP